MRLGWLAINAEWQCSDDDAVSLLRIVATNQESHREHVTGFLPLKYKAGFF
jgi:hypothetical protein